MVIACTVGLVLIYDAQIGNGELEMKARRVTAERCHPGSDRSIPSHQSLQRVTANKHKNTHKFRQAAQLWRLEVVQFAIETGPFSTRRFLFLLEGIIMQGTAIRMELKTKKGVNAIG